MAISVEITIEEARDLIRSTPVPVLMGDTCGLLDLARAPLRPKSGGLKPAIEVVDAPELCRYPLDSSSLQ